MSRNQDREQQQPEIVVSGPEKWIGRDLNGALAKAATMRTSLLQNEIESRPKVISRFVQIEARLETFKEWPTSMPQSPDQLASAGFYYTGSHCNTRFLIFLIDCS